MTSLLRALAIAPLLWAASSDAVAGQTDAAVATDGAVVARVNGDAVSEAEFRRMLGNPLTRGQLRQELRTADPDAKQLEALALRKAIHHRLMLQEAARRNIVVTPAELDEAIAALRRRFADLESFGRWMQEQGLNDKALFEAVRADMLAGRVWASLAEGARINEDEVLRYYEAHKAELVSGEEVRLRIIAVKDKAAADDVLASLKKGASFAQLARQRSEGLRAAQGGDTGWVDSRTLPETLLKAVPRLKPGDVAGPLETGSGEFLLVGLEGRRPMIAKSLAEARPEIERRLLPARQQAVVASWLTEQETKSKIEILEPNRVGR